MVYLFPHMLDYSSLAGFGLMVADSIIYLPLSQVSGD